MIIDTEVMTPPTIEERLIHIETQLTEMHEIFCNLYKAYEAMTSSPMFASLIGNRLGK